MTDLLEALRSEYAATEASVTDLTSTLDAKKTRLRSLNVALTALDPEWASNHKKPAKKSKATPSRDRVQEVLAKLKSAYGPGDTFTSTEAAERLGIHVSTIHRVLKILHEQDAIRLDSLRRGQGSPAKIYALVSE